MIARRSWLKRGTKRPNPVSAKLRKEKARYAVLRVEFLTENPMCGCCEKLGGKKVNPATEIHHYRGKIGRLLCMVKYFIPSCRDCHRWIHDNPAEARDMGLLCEAGQFNSVPNEGTEL